MKWYGHGSKRSWSNLSVILVYAWVYRRKPRETPSQQPVTGLTEHDARVADHYAATSDASSVAGRRLRTSAMWRNVSRLRNWSNFYPQNWRDTILPTSVMVWNTASNNAPERKNSRLTFENHSPPLPPPPPSLTLWLLLPTFAQRLQDRTEGNKRMRFFNNTESFPSHFSNTW
jgi:hypothetical protein